MKPGSRRLITVAALVAGLSCLVLEVGCVTLVRPPVVTVGTPGLVITAEGGAFELSPETTVPTAFATYHPRRELCLQPRLTDYVYALADGATRVRVRHPAHAEPLYGVLLLCRVPAEAPHVIRESYLIKVPDSYVEATSEGRHALVFEPYDVTVGGSALSPAAWILWLSRTPFQ